MYMTIWNPKDLKHKEIITEQSVIRCALISGKPVPEKSHSTHTNDGELLRISFTVSIKAQTLNLEQLMHDKSIIRLILL